MTSPAGRPRAQAHTALFYAAMFAALGAYLPFWPVWLEDWGLTQGEVGLYVGLGVVTRAVAGLALPVIADRMGQRRMTLLLICVVAAGLVAAHVAIDTRLPLVLATLALGALLSALLPLGEALGAGAAHRFDFAYAPVRAMGSVAFLISAMAVGWLIARSGADITLWWMVAALLVSAVLARHHPGGGVVAGQRPPGFAEIFRLFTEPTFALFVCAAALLQSSHAVFYAYGSVHWRALGLDEGIIGALWAFW